MLTQRKYNKQYADIGDLNARMVAVGATNLALAEISGVSVSTIAMVRARRRKMSVALGGYVLEALETRTFSRKPNGRKPPGDDLKAEIASLKKYLAAMLHLDRYEDRKALTDRVLG